MGWTDHPPLGSPFCSTQGAFLILIRLFHPFHHVVRVRLTEADQPSRVERVTFSRIADGELRVVVRGLRITALILHCILSVGIPDALFVIFKGTRCSFTVDQCHDHACRDPPRLNHLSLSTQCWRPLFGKEARSQGSYTTFEYCLSTYPVTYLNTQDVELGTKCDVYETSYKFPEVKI